MSDSLRNYQAICEAISLLLPGQVEVVLHDLMTGKIAHIAAPFSKREAGDDSLIDLKELERDAACGELIGPYSKRNADGESIKSVTAIIRDEQGNPSSLLCVNLKTGAFSKAADLLNSLIGTGTGKSYQSLTSGDWRERANDLIGITLSDLGVSMVSAKRADKLVIVGALEEAEIFQVRGSAEYIAKALGISRASLYGLLREARNSE